MSNSLKFKKKLEGQYQYKCTFPTQQQRTDHEDDASKNKAEEGQCRDCKYLKRGLEACKT